MEPEGAPADVLEPVGYGALIVTTDDPEVEDAETNDVEESDAEVKEVDADSVVVEPTEAVEVEVLLKSPVVDELAEVEVLVAGTEDDEEDVVVTEQSTVVGPPA